MFSNSNERIIWIEFFTLFYLGICVVKIKKV